MNKLRKQICIICVEMMFNRQTCPACCRTHVTCLIFSMGE